MFETELVVGTTNKNKLSELQLIAAENSILLVGLSEHQSRHDLSSPPVVEETGSTYWENVRLKAYAYADWAGVPVLADDSGLEVEILQGEPGVNSAVFVSPGATYAERMQALVKAIKHAEQATGLRNRAACFRCTLLVAWPQSVHTDGVEGRKELVSEGVLSGVIIDEPRGAHGFGYDPIFFLPQLNKTAAELEPAEKARLGHRGQAARKLFPQLRSQ